MEDPELKCYNDNLQADFDAFIKNLGDGEGGMPMNGLNGFIEIVSTNNKYITDTILRATKEEIEWMTGKEECFNIVQQYFETTSEMLDFCHELDKFVVSARTGHDYIEHVIQHLEKDYGMETFDVNGDRNRYKKIVEVMTNLKSSALVGKVSTESLLEQIKCLTDKFNKLIENLSDHQKKYKNMIENQLKWKRITGMIFTTCLVVVGAAAVVATSLALAQPHIAAVVAVKAAVHVYASTALTMVASNPHSIILVATSLLGACSVLGVTYAGINDSFGKAIDEMLNKKKIIDSMQASSYTAIKELGDIKNHIDSLVTSIDTFVQIGNVGADAQEDYSMSFAMKKIKGSLGIFLKKIEELDTKAKSCASEIKTARDDVLKKVKRTFLA